MKTILVPTSGSETDTGVFATALALARSLGAHMEFYHVRLDPCEAALRDPHAHFSIGPAIAVTLSAMEKRDVALSSAAARHFSSFCEQHRIPIVDTPAASESLSAQWLEETNDPEGRLLFHARHCDIIVLGRRHTFDLMPDNLIESLLKKSGRPIVIAPDNLNRALVRTVVVGWKETDECARALMASMPLLRQASRVILLTIDDRDLPYHDLLDLTRELKWNGVTAEPRLASDPKQPVAKQLLETARESEADLLVIGGFGHSSYREQVFGGVTQDLLESADLPVLLMH